ncbi:MAG: UDP-3-O-(3-hydroxymyristoyl)glucosamine N-acyltransferase [Candidatus Omnitrophica bacterium]|nr:UDP-3-O-(3-hydroxymyristoyl)glucosamine N-acyltransferase [Candidatus Omnitrophota bacterium]
MEQTLEALAAHLKGRLIGDGAIRIRNLNHLDAAQEGELTFAEDPRHLTQALQSKASAILVTSAVTELQGRSGISVADPKLAFALLLELFYPVALPEGHVHPSAVIGDTIELGEHVDIRANAVIGHRVRIGRGTIIEAGTFIGDDVTIGERCLIGPNAVVYRQTILGNRVMLHGGAVIGGDGFGYVFHEGRYIKVPQVGNVVIEDDVEIGCNSCVDRATIGTTLIQRGTKIDNLVQIAHNDRIGQHVIMAGQVGLSGSVSIGHYSMLGGKAGVVDHVTLGERVRVGAASVVTKAVKTGDSVWGFPARSVQETKQQMAALSRLPQLLKSLSETLKRVARLEDRLARLEDKPKRPR